MGGPTQPESVDMRAKNAAHFCSCPPMLRRARLSVLTHGRMPFAHDALSCNSPMWVEPLLGRSSA